MAATDTIDEQIAQWLAQIADGDEQAIEKIVEKYYDDLVRVAKRKLTAMPQQVADDEGAVVSALRSFFSGVHGNQFPRLGDRHELWKVLCTLTVRKSIAQIRRHWKKSGEGAQVQRSQDLQVFLDRGPGPAEVALMVDECQAHVDRLEDPVMREIALLRLQGFESKEIAERLDVHLRTVQRKLALISQDWLEDAQGDS